VKVVQLVTPVTRVSEGGVARGAGHKIKIAFGGSGFYYFPRVFFSSFI